MSGRTAILTGASSGIGADTAVELGRLGYHLALGARRLPRLQETPKKVEEAGGRAFAHPLDVRDPSRSTHSAPRPSARSVPSIS